MTIDRAAANNYQPATAANAEPTIGQLVASVSEDLSALVRSEIALAKAEVSINAKEAALGGAFFGVAGYLAMLASILLMITFAYGLRALGLPAWGAFGIVTLVLLLLAGLFALLGKKRLGQVRPPQKSIDSIKKTIDVIHPTA